MSPIVDVLVIGAGQAGLASGYYLQRRGLTFQILEATPLIGGSWSRYYDSLTLFSPARYSALPGLPFPGDQDHYPHRDEVIDYLQTYATHFNLPIMINSQITTLRREMNMFYAELADGRLFQARSVIAATGSFNNPYIPVIPAQDIFSGRVLHAADYRNPTDFHGNHIVVVGAGNSAVQIAVELARVAYVTLATREPVRFVPQRILGKDFHFWTHLTGLDRTQWLSDTNTPVLDSGRYRQALAAGKPMRRAMFDTFTPTGVRWSDGTEEPYDVVLFATGYRPQLSFLHKLGAHDSQGRIAQHRGRSTTVPGLYYVGVSKQRNFASATLRGVGPDAAVVARSLHRYLKQAHGRARPLLA